MSGENGKLGLNFSLLCLVPAEQALQLGVQTLVCRQSKRCTPWAAGRASSARLWLVAMFLESAAKR